MRSAKAHHATSTGPASGFVPTGSTRVDIWIRTVGARRQAFYRCPAVGVAAWQAMGLPLADKALKAGTVSLPGIEGGTVRLHTEDAPTHPMHEAFGRQAQALNGQIDALNLSAAGASSAMRARTTAAEQGRGR
jgi:hypothetical protein